MKSFYERKLQKQRQAQNQIDWRTLLQLLYGQADYSKLQQLPCMPTHIAREMNQSVVYAILFLYAYPACEVTVELYLGEWSVTGNPCLFCPVLIYKRGKEFIVIAD